MARGGARQGTPGKAYANRTDMNTAFAPQTGTTTAAAGGITPPAPAGPPVEPARPGISPDEVPRLDDPSARPTEPLTAGIPFGAGPGSPPDQNRADFMAMKRHLPYLEHATKDPNTPQTVLDFVRYLRSSGEL